MKAKIKTGKNVVKAATAMILAAAICSSFAPNTFFALADAAASKPNYQTDFATWEEEQDAASELNVKLAGEGAVLLKNRDNALPLKASEMNVSVFGDHSDNILQAGGGAGGGSSDRSKTLEDSMTDAGFTMNPMLKGYYSNNGNPSTESDPSGLDKFAGSFGTYNGAAIIVFSRSGSEMRDITINDTTNGLPGYEDKNAHSLMLQDNEKALIEYVKASGKFKKIVVVLNTPSPMEIAELEDDDAISSILWIGLTGADGIMALGKILNGEVNPSGRTVDIYSAKFDTDPTWFNVSNGSNVGASMLVKDKDGNVYDNGHQGFGGAGPNYASFDYEEGIYTGYRFYETAAEDGVLDDLATTEVKGGKNVYGKAPIKDFTDYMPKNDQATYDTTDTYYNRYNGVLYPFGYGLSYTDFKWEVVNATPLTATDATKNDEMTIEVKVTNTGSVAGKDTVELYSGSAYTEGGIEKASKNLVDFAKTMLLQPGQSQVVELTFTPFELAAFDDVDANGNGFAGYELEAGEYNLYISENSHESKATVKLTVAETDPGDVMTKKATNGANGIAWTTDPVTGAKIDNLFSKDDSLKDSDGEIGVQYANTRREGDIMAGGEDAALEFMSRSNFVTTFPDAPTDADVMFTDDAIAFLDAQTDYRAAQDKLEYPWYKEEVPEGWTQVAERKDGDKAEIQLWDMAGVPLTDTAQWIKFMNQLTWDEMVNLVSADGFNTPEVKAIGKPKATDADGAGQLSKGTFWAGAVLVASSWNTELAELQGIMVGNESLFQNVQGWYGPSMNIHRSPFSGRNFEYYSQDGVQSAKIAAAVVGGATSKGCVTYIKHFALNDQEQNRQLNGGVITWCSEQAMREQYLKPFEAAIKEGGAQATMGAFNRIGMMPTVTNYAFYVELTRKQWGLEGFSITDMYAGGNTYWSGNLMVRCGTGPLGTYATKNLIEGEWDAKNNTVLVPSSTAENAEKVASPTQYFAVRDSAMRLLYAAANSNLLANGNKVPLTEYFGEGTQPYVSGGFGSSGQEEIRKEISYKVGESVNYNITLTEEQQKEINGTITYAVMEGELPAGLSFNASRGTITGKPTAAGEYKVTFTATVDKYLTVQKLITFKVTAEGETTPGGDVTIEDLSAQLEELKTQLNQLKEGALTEEDLNTTETELNAKITALENQIKELKENSGNTDSGCGSSLNGIGTIGIALVTVLCAGAVVCLSKKKHDN